MNSYTEQIRALAQCLQEGEDIPLVSVIVTLREAAEKIDELGKVLEDSVKHIDYLQGVINNVTF